MNEIQVNFVAKMEDLKELEFYSKTDNLFKFKRFNDKTLRMDYMYFVEDICSVCNEPHFKRTNNSKAKGHVGCINGIRK